MSFPSHSLFLLSALTLTSCDREERRFQPVALSSRGSEQNPYENNAYAVSQGKTLYNQYNCGGCHSQGGGGMGPPLMDAEWIYGSRPENIYESIVEGRPGGMPAFGGKIVEDQIWQLVAYVRSMSGLLRKDVAPGRSDDMQVRPQEQSTQKAKPRQAGERP